MADRNNKLPTTNVKSEPSVTDNPQLGLGLNTQHSFRF